MYTVYCLWIYKFHFSVTFLLKISPTVLFTHLKIILLQYFLVFNFSFQFSTVSKWTLNVYLSLCQSGAYCENGKGAKSTYSENGKMWVPTFYKKHL